jgi:hypothetical protein
VHVPIQANYHYNRGREWRRGHHPLLSQARRGHSMYSPSRHRCLDGRSLDPHDAALRLGCISVSLNREEKGQSGAQSPDMNSGTILSSGVESELDFHVRISTLCLWTHINPKGYLSRGVIKRFVFTGKGGTCKRYCYQALGD